MAKTTTTIGTVTTTTGYEYTPEGWWPSGKLMVAADGRAIVVYAYWLANSWYWAFRYSDPTRTTWSSEIPIFTAETFLYASSVNQVSSCIDPNGHVHVALLYYLNIGFGRSRARYCKLTKSVGGGWAAGDIVYVAEDDPTLAPHWQQIHMAHDGTWPYFLMNGYITPNGAQSYTVLYPEYPPDWKAIYGVGNQYDSNANAECAMEAHAGTRVVAWKRDYLANEIRATTGTGTSGGVPLFNNGPTVLWSGASLVSSTESYQQFGLNVLYIGHPLVDFVVIARLSDGSLRLQKFKIGTGWTGEVVVKASGALARSTQAVWDADAGLLHFWWTSNQAPLTWNPSDDAVDVSGLSFRTTHPYPYMVDGYSVGFSAAGSGGTSTLSYSYEQRAYVVRLRQQLLTETRLTIPKPIVHTTSYESRLALFNGQDVPLAATGWVYPVDALPEESREWIGRVDCPGRHDELVFEQLQTARMPHALPMAFEGTLQNGIWIKHIPLEFRTTLATVRPVPNAQSMIAEWGAAEWGAAAFAGAASEGEMYDPGHLQIEWRKAWPWRQEPFTKDVWIEVLQGLWTTQKLLVSYIEPIVVVVGKDLALALDMPIGTVVQIPWDSEWPLTAAVYHTWNVLRMSLGVLPHTWRVFNVAGTPSIQHDWTVLAQRGNSLAHLWRVLPGQLLVLHGEDIQLPYATVEKD